MKQFDAYLCPPPYNTNNHAYGNREVAALYFFLFDDRTIMSTASFSTNVIIPSELPADVVHWKRADVQAFLDANKDAYDLDDEDLEIVKSNKIAGIALLQLTEEKLQRIKLRLGPAISIVNLVDELKKAKGLVQPGT